MRCSEGTRQRRRPLPSYLGEIVETGLQLGYTPADFGAERIFVGGEVVTEGLKERATRLFGPVTFVQGYAMTETIPFGGRACSARHLHFEPSRGLLEVIDPETARSVDIGEPGSILVTPFPPYGETTLLLRYDTEDMACRVAEPLACDLRTLPATTDLLGKRRLSVCHADGWTFPRDGSTSKPKHEGIAHQHVMPRDFSGAVTP